MSDRPPAPHASARTQAVRAQAACTLATPLLAALWLAAGSAQAASGAGAAGKALDALLAQGNLAFDNLAAACQTVAPGMASTWQAQAPAVRQKLTQAAHMAFVNVPELQRPLSRSPHDETRQTLQRAASQMKQAAPLALVTGQPFCQSMLNQVQQADVAALARHMRQNYERIRQQVRAQLLPHKRRKAASS